MNIGIGFQKKCGLSRFTALALAMVAMVTTAMAQTAADDPTGKAYQSWHGNFTGAAQPETLTLRNGDLYLYKGGSEPAMLVGTVRGHNLGQGGLYVANLDGNAEGRQSVAFYDPDLDAWSWGSFTGATLTWAPAGQNVGGKAMFHVGNGATFYPVDQVKNAAMPKVASAASSGAGKVTEMSNTPTPFTYPVLGSQYNALSSSQHVWTTFYMDAHGDITAGTRVKEDTLFAGFHAGVSIELYAPGNFDVPLCSANGKDIGVTGTFFGHSDVTVNWTGGCPSNVVPLLRYYAVVQKWSPDWYAALNNVKKLAEDVAGIIKAFESLIPGK